VSGSRGPDEERPKIDCMAGALDGYGDVCCCNVVVTNAHLRNDNVRLSVSFVAQWVRVRRGRKRPECFLRHLDELTMIDATGTDKDHAVSSVVGLDVRRKVIMLDRQDVFLGAENCAT
jgi:hypothetical protein